MGYFIAPLFDRGCMAQLTARQVLNLVGYINYRTNFIQNMVNAIRADPTKQAEYGPQILDAIEEIAKLSRTALVRASRQMPNSEFTDQDLAAKGIS